MKIYNVCFVVNCLRVWCFITVHSLGMGHKEAKPSGKPPLIIYSGCLGVKNIFQLKFSGPENLDLKFYFFSRTFMTTNILGGTIRNYFFAKC